MTISKWVNLIFASVFLVAFVTFNKAFIWIWELAKLTDYSIIPGWRTLTLTTALALAGAVGLTFYLYRMPNAFEYLGEVVTELRRVTWPTLDETKRSTVIVIAFTILLSGYLAVFDWIWKAITDLLITGA